MDILHVISCLQPSWLVLPIAAKQRTPLMGIRHLYHKAGITKTALPRVSCSVLSNIVLMCLLSNTKFWHCSENIWGGKKKAPAEKKKSSVHDCDITYKMVRPPMKDRLRHNRTTFTQEVIMNKCQFWQVFVDNVGCLHCPGHCRGHYSCVIQVKVT